MTVSVEHHCYAKVHTTSYTMHRKWILTETFNRADCLTSFQHRVSDSDVTEHRRRFLERRFTHIETGHELAKRGLIW